MRRLSVSKSHHWPIRLQPGPSRPLSQITRPEIVYSMHVGLFGRFCSTISNLTAYLYIPPTDACFCAPNNTWKAVARDLSYSNIQWTVKYEHYPVRKISWLSESGTLGNMPLRSNNIVTGAIVYVSNRVLVNLRYILTFCFRDLIGPVSITHSHRHCRNE